MDQQRGEQDRKKSAQDNSSGSHEEGSSRRFGGEEFIDEHEHSESGATATAAQQVLNSIVLDEKALERDVRNASRKPRKVMSDPLNHRSAAAAAMSRTNNPHSQSESFRPASRVQFSVVAPVRRRATRTSEEEEEEIPDVNLLHLAAERSRGVYRDVDFSQTCEAAQHDHDLLRGSAYDPELETKRHMHQQSNSWLQADALAKAQAKEGPTALPGTVAAPGTRSSSIHHPGAYTASPGMATQRTPSFHTEIWQHPMDVEATPEVTRSSTNALPPDPNAILPESIDVGNNAIATSDDNVISAVRVDEDDLELTIRDQIASTAAQAQVVDLEKETTQLVEQKVSRVRNRYYAYAAVAFLLVTVVITGMVFIIGELKDKIMGSEEEVWQPVPLTTMNVIRQRGYLICGLAERDENPYQQSTVLPGLIAFNQDICRGIAAAALGGDPNVTFVPFTQQERWKALENGTLDVMLVGTPSTKGSLHWNLDPTIPVQFSTPYVFDGIGVAGMPDYVMKCANKAEFDNYAECRGIKVCVVQGSEASELADELLHPNQVVVVPQLKDIYNRFEDGCCNVIATDYSNDRAEVVMRNMSGYSGPYLMGDGLHSRQPYAAATRKLAWTYRHASREAHLDDPHTWSEFVNWVIHCLIAGEESNVTQATAYKFRQTYVFGEDYKDMFRHAIGAVGNYGEIYDRNRAMSVPRAGMNMLNDGTTGLHYGRSMGNLADFGPAPLDNGTLANILVRGKLRCGLAMPQHLNTTEKEMVEFEEGQMEEMEEKLKDDLMGVAPVREIKGTANIDFEYCKALASAIFQGRLTIDDLSCSAINHQYGKEEALGVARPTVDLVMLKDEADGYEQLDRGSIDVIVGYGMNLMGDVWRESVDEGFTFTQPYFFGPTTGHVTDANRCMVTRQHDQQWSDFVQFVVASLFLAEEGGCVQRTANEMPVVNRFGSAYKRMMRDVVFAVGSYAELYERSVEPLHPRRGTANELNRESTAQFASMPGLLQK